MYILNNIISWRGKDYNSPSPWQNTDKLCHKIHTESVDKTSELYNGGFNKIKTKPIYHNVTNNKAKFACL